MRFRIFRGHFLGVIFFLLGPISVSGIVFGIIIVWTSFDDLRSGLAMTWTERLSVLGAVLLLRGFIVTARCLIFRRLKIYVSDNYLKFIYPPYLFLPGKIELFHFASMTECRVVKTESKVKEWHLTITMMNHRKCRITDAVWEPDSDQDFGIEKIAETYEQYKKQL